MTSSRLPAYEWLIILLFCSILLVLSSMAFARQSVKPISTVSYLEALTEKTHIQVTLKGAVKNPGKYTIPVNSTVQDLIDEVELLSNADMSQIKLRQKLKDRQRIVVPEKKLITIYIEGAIEQPGPFEVMSGTRCQELTTLLVFPPEADVKALQKRKHFLRAQEVVVIPFKKKLS